MLRHNDQRDYFKYIRRTDIQVDRILTYLTDIHLNGIYKTVDLMLPASTSLLVIENDKSVHIGIDKTGQYTSVITRQKIAIQQYKCFTEIYSTLPILFKKYIYLYYIKRISYRDICKKLQIENPDIFATKAKLYFAAEWPYIDFSIKDYCSYLSWLLYREDYARNKQKWINEEIKKIYENASEHKSIVDQFPKIGSEENIHYLKSNDPKHKDKKRILGLIVLHHKQPKLFNRNEFLKIKKPKGYKKYLSRIEEILYESKGNDSVPPL